MKTSRTNTERVLMMMSAAMLALGVQSALAQQGDESSAQRRDSETRSNDERFEVAAADQQRSSSAADRVGQEWRRMRGEVVSAEDLLAAEVSNGFNPVGDVTDLILSEDGRQVQYVLFESSYPYTLRGGIDGFSSFDRVEITQNFYDLTVLLPRDAPPSAPDELRLTRSQARQRLVSRLIDEPMQLAGNDLRQIEDILIDLDTGAVAHYVIETNAETLFNQDRRTVPASRVTIEEDGDVVASVGMDELDPVQQYPRELL
jgi:sporulation protein YlmC with PRC-barrel domain